MLANNIYPYSLIFLLSYAKTCAWPTVVRKIINVRVSSRLNENKQVKL